MTGFLKKDKTSGFIISVKMGINPVRTGFFWIYDWYWILPDLRKSTGFFWIYHGIPLDFTEFFWIFHIMITRNQTGQENPIVFCRISGNH